MRTKWLVLGSALLPMLGILGCSESLDGSNTATRPSVAPVVQSVVDPCGDALAVRFLAGQTIEVGTVTVSNDGSQLCVRIETTGGWVMEETHVAIARHPWEFPQTGSGNPKVGQFALAAEHNPPVADFEHCINLAEYGYGADDSVYVAAHGAVVLLDAGGQVIQSETAWGEGTPFPGNNWAMYLGHTVQACTPPPGESITVTYPDGGDLCLNDHVMITWEIHSECAAVTIELLQGGLSRTLAEGVPSSGGEEYPYVGTYVWQGVEGFESAISGYTIRVVGVSPSGELGEPYTLCGVEDESETFSIIDCTGGGEE